MSVSKSRGLPSAVQARVGWAEKHLDRLDKAIKRLVKDGETYALTREVDPGTFDHTYRVQLLAPIHEHIPLIIGDCLHNIRSVLDHAAFHAVREMRQGLTAEEESEIQFVIADTPERFAKQKERRGVVMGDVLTRIERFQPYQLPQLQNMLLARLRDLDIIDRHRRLHVAAISGSGIDLQEWFDGGIPEMRSPTWWTGPLEDGAIICRARFTRPRPDVDLRPAISVDVAIADVPGDPVLQNVTDMLRFTLGYIVAKVVPGIL